MQVRRMYGRGEWEDIATRRLVEDGANNEGGELEQMRSRISNLERIVAALIDQSGMKPDEVLATIRAAKKKEKKISLALELSQMERN